jgi:hypothetical protein
MAFGCLTTSLMIYKDASHKLRRDAKTVYSDTQRSADLSDGDRLRESGLSSAMRDQDFHFASGARPDDAVRCKRLGRAALVPAYRHCQFRSSSVTFREVGVMLEVFPFEQHYLLLAAQSICTTGQQVNGTICTFLASLSQHFLVVTLSCVLIERRVWPLFHLSA